MKKILTIAILIIALMVSCESDYLDVNTDPHNPTKVNPELVLPVAQVYTANSMGGQTYNTLGNLLMYTWSQTDGFSWYTEEFQYLVTPNFYSGIWDVTYQFNLKQYNVLESYDGDIYDNYKAISKIMKSYHFQYLVDGYGDIPYSEALQRGANPLPKYDDAESVYEGLVSDLDDALALIEAASLNINSKVPSNDDIMFGGDMDTWRKLANTVKMRLLIRMSGMTSKQTFIQDEFNKISTNGFGYIDTDASVNPGYFQETNKQNPFWNSYGQDASGSDRLNFEATCATDFILDYLNNKGDARINFIFETPGTGHLGIPQGLTVYPANTTKEFVSNIGPGLLKGPTQDQPFFTLSESLFLQTEAVEKGYITGNSKDLYEAAIQASFDYLGAGNASGYYGNGMDLVDWNASANKMEAIITQKWLALIGLNGYESWIEYNRTGYPSNLPISLLATSTNRPVRLNYPSSEISANGGNVPSQPNVFTDKVFWAN